MAPEEWEAIVAFIADEFALYGEDGEGSERFGEALDLLRERWRDLWD